ncbi:hypothetical protein L1987_48990 [Smallanthus sonchifolius]|uniref:Uncharacterized protein n=1 Tax=Smallanthus sonchifolius TaxID=185202 RepID=A0ACB9FTI0_9ASTR|nr:hypothetical protein L1987_48990 [Smallanthus sonchifolius]
MEGGQPTIITNAEGQMMTPSVVAYGKTGDQLVAKRQAVVNPENTCSSMKRFIGKKMMEVDEESKQFPYKVELALNQQKHYVLSLLVYTKNVSESCRRSRPMSNGRKKRDDREGWKKVENKKHRRWTVEESTKEDFKDLRRLATSFSITNFPRRWNYDHIVDFYLVRKKDRHGCCYGFVRYINVTYLKLLEKRLNTIKIEGIYNCKIKYILGLNVLIQFDSKDERMNFLIDTRIHGRSGIHG